MTDAFFRIRFESLEVRHVSGIPERVRPHHWGFANAWLKSSFQRIPETIVAALARAKSAAPVRDAWANFSKTLEAEERLEPEGLDAATYAATADGGDWYVAVVEFPPPEHPGEAHFAALAVQPGDGELQPDLEEESPRSGTRFRYFLLEHAESGDPELVEWTGEQRRVLDVEGTGPEADSEAFVRSIIDLLQSGGAGTNFPRDRGP